MLTRRNALRLMAGATGIITTKNSAAAPLAPSLDIEKGPFQATRESLKIYSPPEWFRDAKLGLWAHWGPQSAPEQGDWFAQRMYLEGTPAYKWHLENYGHPSKSGFKDVILTFNARRVARADSGGGAFRRCTLAISASMASASEDRAAALTACNRSL